jgi:hypothetical protein
MADVMFIVYAKVDRAQIWSDSAQIHKAGRVPLGEKLEVIAKVSGWNEINRPAGLFFTENGVDVPAPVQPSYPRYFIDPVFCQNVPVDGVIPVPEPEPEPEPSDEPTDAEVGKVVKWIVKAL